ncbi:hypothetical protein BKA69DRAFT_1057693 [Paraphysoderma sedebokerense]|nr:hypothetical protein BKA69DRAFT_1057693 [Paraphysoderma sedebokerense]
MVLGFFGLEILPGKSYTQEVETSVRINNVALGEDIKSSRTTLSVTVDGQKFPVCSLTPGKIEQQALDLVFTAGETLTLTSKGDNTLYLTGNYLEDSDDDSDDDSDLQDLDPEEAEKLLAEYYAQMANGEMSGSEDDEGASSEDDEEMIEAEGASESEEEESDQEEEEEEEKAEEKVVKKAQSEATKAGQKRKSNEAASSPAQSEPAEKKSKQENGKAVSKSPDSGKQEQKQQSQKQKVEKKEAQDKKQKQQPKNANENESGEKSVKKLPNGLVIEDIKGGSGPKAKPGRKVSVRYIGRLKNGKVFDKNTSGAPFQFQLGRGEVIKGWDMGIQGMNVGGQRKLTIPAALAYGKRGAPPDIPPNSTLEFEVKLLGVN